MAESNGQTTNHLIAELSESPYAYDFYAAIRLLQSNFRDHPRIGHSTSPKQDPIRFAQNPSLEFAPATLEAVLHRDVSRPPVVYSHHFGLFGSHGPLPLCLTEYARDRIMHHGDRTFASFCNVFHHRLASFFFRAWADARKTVDFDRPADQHWAYYIGSLAGLGLDSLRQRDSVPDRAKLYFTGRLVQQTRNTEGLEAILEDFFEVPAEVQTFVGRWLNLPAGNVCKLGASRATGGLGTSIIMGSRVWTCQMHFRIRLGPMSLAALERLLPSGSSFQRLKDWIRQYTGDEFTWDAQLVLAKEEVPETKLGKAGRLGWTTWLKTKPFEHDAEDLVLSS